MGTLAPGEVAQLSDGAPGHDYPLGESEEQTACE